MPHSSSNPRILIVTPEVSFFPDGMGSNSDCLNARSGGIADVSASLISALYQEGADVHVALPDYRSLFRNQLPPDIQREWKIITETMPGERIHLARDRVFFYLDHLYYGNSRENIEISLAFQRDVINNIEPVVVQPDLISLP
jgi:starch synthase/alpha-amylase